MAEEMAAPQGEQAEDAELQKILALCQSGNPAALGQIAEIVKGLMSHNEAETAEMAAEGEGEPSSRDQMVAAVKKSMGA